MIRKIKFSAGELAEELDDRERFSQWLELANNARLSGNQYRSDSGPFSAEYENAFFAGASVSRFGGTIRRFERTTQHIATDPRSGFTILVARDQVAWSLPNGREHVVAPGGVTLIAHAETTDIRSESDFAFTSIAVPRQPLVELVQYPEDMMYKTVAPDSPALHYLLSYAKMLQSANAIAFDDALNKHVETTIVDLVALVLGAGGEAADVARGRGLKAVRLSAVLSEIKRCFNDPAFSPRVVAQRLGVSPRYVNFLVHETGVSFTERVLELRLQHARAMLANPTRDRYKISDIALSCGFNEISYFNRCFRRRFGASPTQYRGGPTSG